MRHPSKMFMDLAADTAAEEESQLSVPRRLGLVAAVLALLAFMPMLWANAAQAGDDAPQAVLSKSGKGSDGGDDDSSGPGSGGDDDDTGTRSNSNTRTGRDDTNTNTKTNTGTGKETRGKTDGGNKDTGKSTRGETDPGDKTGKTERR